jgi:hypothetical protein
MAWIERSWGIAVAVVVGCGGSDDEEPSSDGSTEACFAPCDSVDDGGTPTGGTSGATGGADETADGGPTSGPGDDGGTPGDDGGDDGADDGADDGNVDGGELPPGDDCRTAADCVIDDDCCHCYAYPELPPKHECQFDVCEQTRCAAEFSSIDPELACDNGNCVFAKIDCDPDHVTCDESPPECYPQQRPAVIDGCWGPCLNIHRCAGFLYPGASCPEGFFEIRWSECAGDSCGLASACEPIPEACAGEPACGCGIEEVCAAYGYECFDGNGGPFCCTGDTSVCSAAG